MKKNLLLAATLFVFNVSFAQKKTVSKPIPKPAVKTVVKPVEMSFLPAQMLKEKPTKPLNPEIYKKLKTQNFDQVVSENIPLDETNPDFMYDYQIFYQNKKTILVKPDGSTENIPEGTNLINVFKDGSQLFSDKCIEKTERFECNNLRIVSKDGSVKYIPSNYFFLIDTGNNVRNFNNKSFFLVYSKNSGQNLFDEKGILQFTNDLYMVKLLDQPYAALYESSEKISLFDLLNKKTIQLGDYVYNNEFPTNGLIVVTQTSNNQKALVDPKTQKVLFTTNKFINTLGKNGEVAKDFFLLGANGDIHQLIDRTGKIWMETPEEIVNISNDKVLLEKGVKNNEYDLTKKVFLYPDFYKTKGSNQDFSYVQYDKFYTITDKKTGAVLYDQKDRVEQFGEKGNLYYFNRTVEGGTMAGTDDLYSFKEGKVVAKDGNVGRIESTDKYMTYRLQGGMYHILTADGTPLISNIAIPSYIQFNNQKQRFEQFRKQGKLLQCTNLKGENIDCEK